MTYKRFVVTGTGRSGTKFASHLFTRCGLPCTHQSTYTERNRAPNPDYQGKKGASSAFAAPYVNEINDDTLIIHQVRNPERVIASLIKNRHLVTQKQNDATKRYVEHVDLSGCDTYAEQAAALWVRWNNLVLQAEKRKNYILHRVEDYNAEFVMAVGESLGVKIKRRVVDYVLKELGQDTGTSGYTEPVRINTLRPSLRDEVMQVAQHVGYFRPEKDSV